MNKLRALFLATATTLIAASPAGAGAVCHLSGPNVSQAAAEKLRAWVQRGGTLWLTAGAASRDEYNRPMHTLDDILPATRGDLANLQSHTASGRTIALLSAKDKVRWEGGRAEVLSADEQREGMLMERAANPWKFPAGLRDFILTPVRSANVVRPITCSTPLVDAVFMPHKTGILIPLANYTAEPISALKLTVKVPRAIRRAESVMHGPVQFTQSSPQSVEFSLPLENNDFVKLHCK